VQCAPRRVFLGHLARSTSLGCLCRRLRRLDGQRPRIISAHRASGRRQARLPRSSRPLAKGRLRHLRSIQPADRGAAADEPKHRHSGAGPQFARGHRCVLRCSRRGVVVCRVRALLPREGSDDDSPAHCFRDLRGACRLGCRCARSLRGHATVRHAICARCVRVHCKERSERRTLLFE